MWWRTLSCSSSEVLSGRKRDYWVLEFSHLEHDPKLAIKWDYPHFWSPKYPWFVLIHPDSLLQIPTFHGEIPIFHGEIPIFHGALPTKNGPTNTRWSHALSAASPASTRPVRLRSTWSQGTRMSQLCRTKPSRRSWDPQKWCPWIRWWCFLLGEWFLSDSFVECLVIVSWMIVEGLVVWMIIERLLSDCVVIVWHFSV